MRKRSILFVLLQACAAPLSPAANAPEPPRHPWAGFAPGSWVLFEIRSLAAEAEGSSLSSYRDELTGFSDTGLPRISSTWKSPRAADFQPSSSPLVGMVRLLGDGLTERGRVREHWTVAGQRMPCTVIEYQGESETLTLWRGDAGALPAWNTARVNNYFSLPADVVHAVRTWHQGKTTATLTLDTDDLDAKVEVGNRVFDCVVTTMISITRHGDGTVVTRAWRLWLSADMPGGLVRRERQCTNSPTARPGDCTVVDKVTAFNSVRP